ncbi:hypothetical protein [Pseudomonas sp. C2B4]|uniref:hypothetical protein n=1 Tax=Pseudomonas sp. C2B4 TaxID=2735270 RepID=UPI0015864298|nr:hypothetical protein [Pseudomonas sp. C2B4]NUU38834.1 hypothetical protein [Pseudomonas sp. C2B4]
MIRNRAPNLSSVRCCGALETWPRSQYSPRPPESALKKSPDLIPDQKANLSRHWTVPRHSPITLNRLFLSSRAGVFLFSKALAQRLLTALKLTAWMIFFAVTEKGATPERRP